ncbi:MULTISPECIES: DUF488 family protein, N3 subclade [Bacillus]|uniref:DUF488 family protein, N3 subclade n=1 Tax=Bacillus TaxID=1386 RepID=UPI000BF764DE|nr:MULTISPECIES: DUF488 family protein [Bacillus]KAA1804764.1 hypothetical protein FXB61_004382 [Bacillus cereus]MCU5320196.1 DUF488 domain-containing protein [Bacillus cereus]MCU5573012.1 DUF488 domain-containing protein [Bacillus cereus]PFA44860.1 hypothetical protein CN381_13995 [Bacillus cereus]PKS13563.1 DUF488 domain-containing protein [Bacillus sp. BI3]
MNQPKGRLYTSNPAGLRFLKEEAEIWQITRGGISIPNTILVRGLSPSPQLFQTFIQDWKDKPFNEWWDLYEKRFLVEMKNDEKLRGLRDVYKKLLMGKNVVLVCFCKDHRYCHRRLVGEFFKPYGVEAIELNPISQDQLSLF